MAFKCIAVDDELPALELIKNYVAQTSGLQLIQSFHDAITASEFLRTNEVDLLFVDINMPDINGIDLVSALQNKPLIIFTTAYKKFAYEGFELDAIDYLLKPISFDRFRKSINKAVEKLESKVLQKAQPGDILFVRSEYKMLKIELNDVEYIEGLEDYIRMHILNSKPVLTLMTMKSILEKLPAGKFLRIHRSYIVALSKIAVVSNKKVKLNTGATLPVSETYASELNKYINK